LARPEDAPQLAPSQSRTNLIALHQVRDVTIEIDYVARALREYVVTGAQTETTRTAGLSDRVFAA